MRAKRTPVAARVVFHLRAPVRDAAERTVRKPMLHTLVCDEHNSHAVRPLCATTRWVVEPLPRKLQCRKALGSHAAADVSSSLVPNVLLLCAAREEDRLHFLGALVKLCTALQNSSIPAVSETALGGHRGVVL